MFYIDHNKYSEIPILHAIHLTSFWYLRNDDYPDHSNIMTNYTYEFVIKKYGSSGNIISISETDDVFGRSQSTTGSFDVSDDGKVMVINMLGKNCFDDLLCESFPWTLSYIEKNHITKSVGMSVIDLYNHPA